MEKDIRIRADICLAKRLPCVIICPMIVKRIRCEERREEKTILSHTSDRAIHVCGGDYVLPFRSKEGEDQREIRRRLEDMPVFGRETSASRIKKLPVIWISLLLLSRLRPVLLPSTWQSGDCCAKRALMCIVVCMRDSRAQHVTRMTGTVRDRGCLLTTTAGRKKRTSRSADRPSNGSRFVLMGIMCLRISDRFHYRHSPASRVALLPPFRPCIRLFLLLLLLLFLSLLDLLAFKRSLIAS